MGSISSPIHYKALKGSISGKIIETELQKTTIGANEVLLKILYSGVCGTDAHFAQSEIVLGHEGVGLVKEVGRDVRHLKMYVRRSSLCRNTNPPPVVIEWAWVSSVVAATTAHLVFWDTHGGVPQARITTASPMTPHRLTRRLGQATLSFLSID